VGGREATTVGDRRGLGVEEPDESADVPGFPCLLEVFDEIGLMGRGSRGSL
jgi:hypothetical protein